MVEVEGDDQLWGSGRGAIAGCHSSVLWLGGPTLTLGEWTWCHLLGAIAGCPCSVLWFRGRVRTNFGGGRGAGMDVVPLLGAIVVCYG